MKLFSIAFITLLTLAATSCKEEKKEMTTPHVVEETDSQTGVTSLCDYTIDDTIHINGKLYRYTCKFEHVDTMPVLINSQGLEYHESRVRIDIRRDSTKVFSKTFYKSNFSNIVPSDFLKTSTMIGVNYNYIKRDKDRSALYFIVTVGDPDETSDGMAYPLELKVNPDGSHSFQKAQDLETGPLSNEMSKDFSDEGV